MVDRHRFTFCVYEEYSTIRHMQEILSYISVRKTNVLHHALKNFVDFCHFSEVVKSKNGRLMLAKEENVREQNVLATKQKSSLKAYAFRERKD